MVIAFQPSFDDLSTPLFDVTFCVLDLETTGGSALNCEITEIGAVKYRHGDLIGSFQTLVDPGLAIPPSIILLTGITEAMVVDAPDIETALPSFLEFIGNAVIVGHNVRFDLSFLNSAAIRLGYGRLENQSVDTAALARRMVRPEVRNLKLGTLAAHFRSPVTPNHRALDDARATAHVLHGLLERVGSLGVTNLDDLLQLPTAKGSPHFSKMSLTDDLPRKPGIYIFKDRQGTPIYVGKATNLRARVRQYFYGDKRRTIANMMKELETIEHQVCATVLEAEITELRLIHGYRPRYNRRSRPPKNSHFVKLTRERFPRLSVVRTIREDGLVYLGPFRSKRAADLVVTALWDSQPIRRCRARAGSRTGKCAPAQLGVAMCPCDGTQSEVEYGAIVERLIDGIENAPHALLDPLIHKMGEMANAQRFEEAGWLRDRHDALARCLDLRRSWTALGQAGVIEIETEDASRVVIDHGTLVESRLAGDAPGLSFDNETQPIEICEVPTNVQQAEEAATIWKWLTSNPVRIVKASGPLALPINPVARLKMPSRNAA